MPRIYMLNKTGKFLSSWGRREAQTTNSTQQFRITVGAIRETTRMMGWRLSE